ncbi:hypothetical protein C7S15_5199 [Burkholderia cepacia]|nr:hypothetical protein [Burkholderia cepacia]
MRGLRLHSWRLLASRDEIPAGTAVGPLKDAEGIESRTRGAGRELPTSVRPRRPARKAIREPHANRVAARAVSRRPARFSASRYRADDRVAAVGRQRPMRPASTYRAGWRVER